ncbi:LuxR C-terminal-related transcriptional regulator [Pseudomonas japonica]|uniref:LuxR C-terminal-related transcriptional regulator n=1 Tax=Pseudomonas japonica TaxID=256466 RepID=UPI00380A10A6
MSATPDILQWWLTTNARFDDCRTPEELFAETARQVRSLGFERFAHGRRPRLPFSQARTRFNGNYPADWRDDTGASTTLRPGLLIWDRYGQAPGDLREHGYASGATCIQRGADGAWQLLCVARRKGSIKSRELLPLKLQLRSLLELLDEHLQRVEGLPPKIILSERETQILRWIADGKCSKGIAGILELSEHTVNFHIKSILRKFDSPNRVLAAAHAAALGLI